MITIHKLKNYYYGKKIKFFTVVILLTGSLSFFNWGCNKNSEDIVPEESLTTETPNLKNFEIATLNFTGTLSEQTYTGDIGGKTVKITRTDSSLMFVVPELSTGKYDLLVNINGTNYSVNFNITQQTPVENPEQYLTDLNSELNNLIDNTLKYTKEMLSNGLITPEEAQEDSIFWNNKKTELANTLDKLTESEKQEFADFYDANKEWIDEFKNYTSANYYKTTDACQDIYDAGLRAYQNNERYTATYYALRYKFCKLETVQKLNKYMDKIKTVIKNFDPTSFMATMWNFSVQPTIDRLAKELDVNKNEVVGQKIESVGSEAANKYDKKTISFKSNEPQSIYANIQYRAINSSDINSGNAFSNFANFFNDFIETYNEYTSLTNEELVYEPEFSDNTEVVPFNRFMTITNISNSDVALKASEIVDDKWFVTFYAEPDTIEDYTSRDFSFDIIYNDGKIRLTKTVNATITISSD